MEGLATQIRNASTIAEGSRTPSSCLPACKDRRDTPFILSIADLPITDLSYMVFC